MKLFIFPISFLILAFTCCAGQQVKKEQQLQPGLNFVAELPKSLKETSGLVYFQNHLLTHNDQGGTPELYLLDTLGNLLNKILVNNTSNNDWEDITQSKSHIYIGDFGNNQGNRTDLQIIRIKKSDIKPGESKAVSADGIIQFQYPNQTNFSPNKDHDFDCEAVIYHQDNLYLFTKNRGTKQTSTIYQLPAKPGKYKAQQLGTIEVPGLVTGASIQNNGSQICLTVYNKKGNCFLAFISHFNIPEIHLGKITLIELGDFHHIGQLEGVDFATNNKLYLSCEKVKELPAAGLYKFLK